LTFLTTSLAVGSSSLKTSPEFSLPKTLAC
jgi:hypothetical protein